MPHDASPPFAGPRPLALSSRPASRCRRDVLLAAFLGAWFPVARAVPAEMASVRLGAGSSPAGGDHRVPEAWAAPVERPPEVDGHLDDGAWSRAEAIVLGKLEAGGETWPRSAVRLVQSSGVLYVGCDFEEPKTDGLVKAVRQADGPVYQDDSVEIFLSPDPSRGYFQIIAGASGTIFDRRDHGDPSAWNSGAKAAVAMVDKGWSIEMAVPLASLGVGGEPPPSWRANIYRNRHAGPEGAQQAFSPTYSADYDVPERFGLLYFTTEPPWRTDDSLARKTPDGTHRSISRAISFDDLGPKGTVLLFDLSAIPDGARVRRARLVCERRWDGGEADLLSPIEIFPLAGPHVRGRVPEALGPPLELAGPPFRSFEVTRLVEGWLGRRDSAALHVKRFPGWRRQETRLDVMFEPAAGGGPPPPVPAQVEGLRTFHRAGQTFLSWDDREDRFGEAPAAWEEIRRYVKETAPKRPVMYRIYRHSRPIDAASVREADLIDEVAPLSGFNINSWSLERLVNQTVFGREDRGELGAYGPFERWTPDSPEGGKLVIPRLAIEDGKSLPGGTALYVRSAKAAEDTHYAVTAVVDGVENLNDFSAANSLAGPIREAPAEWEPVEQPAGERFGFDFRGTRRFYVTWVAPPLAPRPMYFNWSVLVPAEAGGPLPVELYFHRPDGSHARPPVKFLEQSIQICPHDFPFSGWYGFNEAAGTLVSPGDGVVKPHTIRRIEAYLKWAARRFPIDPGRIIAVGGDGAALLALHRPQLCAYVLVTGFETLQLEAKEERRFREAWGPASPRVRDEEGRSGWAWGELDRLLCGEPMPAVLPLDAPPPSADPAAPGFKMSLPLFVCRGPSWGRNPDYGHGRGRFYYALQATRNPLHAHWAWGGNLTAPEKFSGLWQGLDLRAMTPVPAITRSASDAEGEGSGQTNAGYRWHEVKEDDRGFEVTVTGPPGKFDLTPRRLSRFKLRAGDPIAWKAAAVEVPNWDRAGKPEPLSGETRVDGSGLITLSGLELVRGWGLRIQVTRAGKEDKQP